MADLSLHEAGHTWGLYHVFSPFTNEAMGVTYAPGDILGVNVQYRDGSFPELGGTHGGGRGPQNSYRTMFGLFVTGTWTNPGPGGAGAAALRSGRAAPLRSGRAAPPPVRIEPTRHRCGPQRLFAHVGDGGCSSMRMGPSRTSPTCSRDPGGAPGDPYDL